VVESIASVAVLIGCSGSGASGSGSADPAGQASAASAASTAVSSGSSTGTGTSAQSVGVAANLAGGRQICSLVAAEDGSTAYGAQAKAGVPGTDGARNSCTFILADNNVVVTGLLNWSDALEAETDAAPAIDGIGDRAWFTSPAFTAKSGDLDLVIVATATDVARAAALAKVVVPKL